MDLWDGMVNDYLIGQYIFPTCRLNGPTYSIFLQEALPELLAEVPASIRSRIWYQNMMLPHFSTDLRNYLEATYVNRCIGQGGPVRCPLRSPDSSCLDFFLWGHLKNTSYDTLIDS
ncbi:hypothetical protein AVEN_109626-1 [Araneus ventricosus]|uniref:Uncharacterized protein n=1 Tax=Araneus ventricosus TaxID=182803 RepID=A0A4Y2FQJ1_ARAVE|nr:hypothetical protein AVEN_109626-1 [Araneus ventricosus]